MTARRLIELTALAFASWLILGLAIRGSIAVLEG